MLKQFETVLVVLLLLPLVFGRLQYFGIDAKIVDSNLKVKITVFKPGSSFSFKVLSDVKNLTSNALCKVKNQRVVCKEINKTSLNLEFISTNAISQGEFFKVYDQFILPEDVDRVSCILTLPVGAVVANRTDAVFPANYKTLSNGRNILVYWELANVSSAQPLSFQVYYQPPSTGLNISFTIKLLVIVVGALIIFFVSLLREKSKKTEEMVFEVLDEYEKKIFDLVREHGKIKQKKLVELTGFSKARVSRVVRSLARRGLVSVEHRGRNNFVKLKKKKVRTIF